MSRQQRLIDIELDQSERIVRISCSPAAPADCASYIGRQLGEILEPIETKGESRCGKLLGDIQCQYTVEKSGQYSKCAIYSDTLLTQKLIGCFARLDRAAEMVADVSGIPYTFAVGSCSEKFSDPHALVMPQYKMLTYLHDPMAIITTDGSNLVIALPKIEPSELGQIFGLFRAECIEEFGHQYEWKFGAVTLHPPFELDEILSICRLQGETGITFAKDQLRKSA